MQGTLIDLPNTDYLLFQDIFRTTNWPDKLVMFWFKMRHNVTACNYTYNYGMAHHLPVPLMDIDWKAWPTY